jgi:predicted peroxiredoxin
MGAKAVVSLATGMEDPERVTVALLIAIGAAEQGRETRMFLTKEAVRSGWARPGSRRASPATGARRCPI